MKTNQVKTLIKLLAAVLVSTVFSFHTLAQSLTVSGNVKDTDGAPLAGVYVLVSGTNTGTSTDLDGNYSIEVPSGAKELEFSLLGMETVTVKLGASSKYDVVMEISSTMLDGAVSVGYGTMIKKEISTAVASVKSEELTERSTSMNLMQSLSGKVAGVRAMSYSGRPGGKTGIRVRGNGSINAGNDPVYVLDGAVGVDPAMINPNDIESIDILKDAAATAMYGAQGANGVVLITTKSGRKGQTSVTYDAKIGFSELLRRIDVLDADGYVKFVEDSFAYSGEAAPHLTSPLEKLFNYQKDASGNYMYDERGLLIASPKYNTDWQDVMTRTALIQEHNLSLVSGNDKTSIYTSLGYQDQDGVIINTGAKKMTGTINVKSKITDWLDYQAIASISSQTDEYGDDESMINYGAIRQMLEMLPILPVKYEDGTYAKMADYPGGMNTENPVQLINQRVLHKTTNQAMLNMGLNFHITKDLTLTVKGDYQYRTTKRGESASRELTQYAPDNGFAEIHEHLYKRMSNEDYLTYDKSFFGNKWKTNFVLGASWYYYRTEDFHTRVANFSDDIFQWHNLQAAGEKLTHLLMSGMSEQTMNSFYFRMNHNILGRYMIGATLRADGASNFGANNKYGFFPSASAAWLLSEEPFFEPAKKAISNLKLRVSYGSVGNASIPSYTTISQYSNGTLFSVNGDETYAKLNNLANGDLKWETTRQFDVGIDLGLFKDRIEIIADYYKKLTNDLLFSKQVPATTGYTSSWSNLGQISNTGFELTITSHNFNRRNFQWDTDIIFSTNKTMVDDINGDMLNLLGGLYWGDCKWAVEGREWGALWVYNRLGTWGIDEVEQAAKYGAKPGDLKYEDLNGDFQYTDADRVWLDKTLTPKGEVSLVNTFNIHGLTVMLDLGARYGNLIYCPVFRDFSQPNHEGFKINAMSDALNAWTPDNQNTMVPAVRKPSESRNQDDLTDNYKFLPGDFLRIRNIMVSYDFKRDVLKNCKAIKGLTFGISVENPYVFTSYIGYDPEVGAHSPDAWMGYSNYNVGEGVDNFSYGRPMTITGNLKITF